MPHAPVDDQDTRLYYEDSGPPPNSKSYVTLVIIHGTVFHAAAMKPLLPFAAECNLRIVLVNLRDYPGSSPYSEEELAVIRGSDRVAQAAFVEARGLEVARFLAWYIRKERIPPLEKDSLGGLSIMAWSFGNATTVSMFAHVEKINEEDQKLIASYIRSYILLDPPFYAFGLPILPLDKMYNPLRDPSVLPTDAPEAFTLWVSSYYHHMVHRTEDYVNLSLDEALSKTQNRASTNPPPHEHPTLHRMSTEEAAKIADLEGAPRSHVPLLHLDPAIYAGNLRSALRGQDVWPHLRIEHVWCAMGPNETIYAAWSLAALLKELKKTRPTRFWTLEGANHFPQWDCPERTLKLVSELV